MSGVALPGHMDDGERETTEFMYILPSFFLSFPPFLPSFLQMPPSSSF